jgi:hypothetical protein
VAPAVGRPMPRIPRGRLSAPTGAHGTSAPLAQPGYGNQASVPKVLRSASKTSPARLAARRASCWRVVPSPATPRRRRTVSTAPPWTSPSKSSGATLASTASPSSSSRQACLTDWNAVEATWHHEQRVTIHLADHAADGVHRQHTNMAGAQQSLLAHGEPGDAVAATWATIWLGLTASRVTRCSPPTPAAAARDNRARRHLRDAPRPFRRRLGATRSGQRTAGASGLHLRTDLR